MAVQNIVIFIILACLGIFNSIYAENLRDVDIPSLNITRMAGMWHMVAIYEEYQLLECSTSVVIPQSDDSYILNVTYSFKPEAIKNNSEIANGTVTESLIATMEKDSNVIKSRNKNNEDVFWVMFDVDYDSHLAIYATKTVEALTSGTDGFIFIVSRQSSLKEGIIDRVKQSTFYQQAVKPGFSLTQLDATNCV